jgi:hypothetical protein
MTWKGDGDRCQGELVSGRLFTRLHLGRALKRPPQMLFSTDRDKLYFRQVLTVRNLIVEQREESPNELQTVSLGSAIRGPKVLCH